ncbi:hypothetical protein GALL_411230 [mine drainage metagenome]|uniref:Uncharacterized protein n=1 Tax=mine drainage metagenome TaxID=410659 RepID=A0A1J5QB26_9ZZZZ
MFFTNTKHACYIITKTHVTFLILNFSFNFFVALIFVLLKLTRHLNNHFTRVSVAFDK